MSDVVKIKGYSESEGAQNIFIEMFDRELEDGSSVAVSNNGTLYVSDAGRHVIWKASEGGPSSVFAGQENTSGMENGVALSAKFNAPKDIAVDSSGTLYVYDSGNNRIRKISRNGNVSTFASFDTASTEILIDISKDEVLYASVAPNILTIQSVANSINSVFDRTITDGSGVAVGDDGTLYVSDKGRHVIWMQKGGLTSTRLSGRTNDSGFTNGVAANAQFDGPSDMAVDSAGNLYVYDSGNNVIRKVNKNGYTTTIATLSETVTKTRVTVSPNGTVYIVSLSRSISSSSSASSGSSASSCSSTSSSSSLSSSSSISSSSMSSSSSSESASSTSSASSISSSQSSSSSATVLWWVNDDADDDADNANNWSNTEGGTGGAGIPTSGDPVFFSVASSNTDCTLSANFNANYISFGTNYTGTLDLNDFNLTTTNGFTTGSFLTVLGGSGTLSCGGDFVVGGTFTPETSTVKVTGTGNFNTGSSNLYDLEIDSSGTVTLTNDIDSVTNSVTVTNGILDVDSYALTFGAGGFTQTGGTVSGSGKIYNGSNSGDVTISGTATNTAECHLGSTATINVSSANVLFSTLRFERTIAAYDAHNFTLTGLIPCTDIVADGVQYDMYFIGTGTVTFAGDMTTNYSGSVNMAPTTGGGNIFKWNGSGTSTVSDPGGNTCFLPTEIAGSGSLVLSGSMKAVGYDTNGVEPEFKYTSGTVVSTGSFLKMHGGWNIDWSSGGSQSINDLEFRQLSGTSQYTLNGTLNVDGFFNVPSSTASNISPAGTGGMVIKEYVNCFGNWGTVTPVWDIELAGTTDQNYAAWNTNLFVNVTISNTDGIIKATSPVTWSGNVTTDLGATLCSNGNDITITGTLTNNGTTREVSGDTISAGAVVGNAIETGAGSCAG